MCYIVKDNMPRNSKKTDSITSSFQENHDEILNALNNNKITLEDMHKQFKTFDTILTIVQIAVQDTNTKSQDARTGVIKQ